MKVLVINGSPKGDYSTTLQTVLYIQKKNPDCSFEVLNAGQKINSLEKDFSEAQAMVERFSARLEYETRLVNIHDFPFKGGCISCFNCAVDGEWVYKDGFRELLRNEIQTCSAI